MLDARRLRLLAEFASRGSIAATAAALGYSASAVSQQLAALEREAGTALFERTARTATLTDAGRRLAVHAVRVLAAIEEAEAELAADRAVPAGPVVVAAFPTAAVALAPAVARLLQQHPMLTFELRQAARDDSLRRLRAGDVDVALVDDWTGARPDEGEGLLRWSYLLTDPVVLVVPRAHPLADPDRAVDVGTLARERWVVAPPYEPSRHAVDAIFAAGPPAPAMPWELEGLDTVLALVARGLGISAVPALALSGPWLDVVARPLPDPAPYREVWAVSRAARVRHPAVAATLRVFEDAAATVDLARFAGARARSSGAFGPGSGPPG